MREARSHQRATSWLVIACLLPGCTVVVPPRFLVTDEAFSPSATTEPSPTPPWDSVKDSVFEAEYEAVFQAASQAASQALFDVESTDKSRGVIRATRFATVRNQGSAAAETTRKYFYEIAVREIGPESTEVKVIAKFQESCAYYSAGGWTMISLVSLGILLPTALIAYPLERSWCNDAAELQWATGANHSLQEMGQLMTFTRNNLIASGVM